MFAHGGKMVAARHKSHVGAAGGEPGTEITADAARTHYGNFHAHAPCRSDRQDADRGGRYSIFWPFRAVAPATSGPVARMERSVIRDRLTRITLRSIRATRLPRVFALLPISADNSMILLPIST